MKSLEEYNNMDKAELLFQLFPKEMPELICFIEGMSISIIQDEDRKTRQAEIDLASFLKQLLAAKDAHARIEKHGSELQSNQRLFARELCDETLASFTRYCIIVYVSVRQHPNQRFVHLVHALWG